MAAARGSSVTVTYAADHLAFYPQCLLTLRLQQHFLDAGDPRKFATLIMAESRVYIPSRPRFVKSCSPFPKFLTSSDPRSPCAIHSSRAVIMIIWILGTLRNSIRFSDINRMYMISHTISHISCRICQTPGCYIVYDILLHVWYAISYAIS